MIGFDVWTEVHARARRGEAKQQIARGLGLDRKTVRRILGQARPMPYQRRVRRPSLVAPYLDYISWPEPFPEVEVRELACYEALVSQEVGHG
jgi:transposase